jgi:hypothetical protein
VRRRLLRPPGAAVRRGRRLTCARSSTCTPGCSSGTTASAWRA